MSAKATTTQQNSHPKIAALAAQNHSRTRSRRHLLRDERSDKSAKNPPQNRRDANVANVAKAPTKAILRVQSGYLKGRALKAPAYKGTRPTKSIVKACVFNVLRQELADAEFIEAFGGSASMAIEAISNGALGAHVCECNAIALKIARENCSGLPISVHEGDAFELLGDIIAAVKSRQNRAIVYLDPPFSSREGFGGIYERLHKSCAGADIAIIEHESACAVRLDGFLHLSTRKFGKSSVSFFAKTTNA